MKAIIEIAQPCDPTICTRVLGVLDDLLLTIAAFRAAGLELRAIVNNLPEGDMNERYERYLHHGIEVAVRSDLKGRHRQHCMCFSCKKFNPDCRETNCPTANLLYALAVRCALVAPVWECPDFAEVDVQAVDHTGAPVFPNDDSLA